MESTDYQRIAEAIEYLDTNYRNQPELDDLAAHLHLSPFHLQRLFTRWAGISPKRFVQYLTVQHAKQRLNAAQSVLDAALDAGLSGPGRLHDLLVVTEAVTPGEYKSKGAGLTIRYGRHTTPFGDCLLAATERGVCKLAFVGEEGWAAAVDDLRQQWGGATLVQDPAYTQPLLDLIFPPASAQGERKLNLLLKGTNFQLKVWEALLRIPPGDTTSYEAVAKAIGQPEAARAVGGAVGSNSIAYLIPCHRVIRKSGVIQDYHWGATRKKAILLWEAAHQEAQLAA
ncbi:MAG TPA: methylated-DNA--[protein]-cysteine S-methyltransferase [Caldilineaceae bacterium]|nr:methylated-DNA--[protein]-cysteine S-methyltransferase [Caldilineaceae bacterium]